MELEALEAILMDDMEEYEGEARHVTSEQIALGTEGAYLCLWQHSAAVAPGWRRKLRSDLYGCGRPRAARGAAAAARTPPKQSEPPPRHAAA